MSRFVKVIQIECDDDGKPLCSPENAEDEGVFVRFGLIDRKKKNKTFFSSKTIDNTSERFRELRGGEIVQGPQPQEAPQHEDMPEGMLDQQDEKEAGSSSENPLLRKLKRISTEYGQSIDLSLMKEEAAQDDYEDEEEYDDSL